MPAPDLTHILNPERLSSLRNLGLLDTPTDPAFDRLTRLASMMLKMPVALVTLVDAKRQFFKSAIGLPEPWASMRETPLTFSFCQHVVASGEPLIIEDAREHPLVSDNPIVQRLNLIAYAGMPLTTSTGLTLGSFCAIDVQPHQWTDEELIMLADLSGTVMTEIELRGELIERQRIEQELREKDLRLNTILMNAPIVLYALDTDGNITLSQGKALNHVGQAQNATIGQSALEKYASRPDIQCSIQRALQGETFSVVAEVWGRSFSTSYSPLLNEDGTLGGTIGVATDIHELVEAQTALQASLKRLSDLEQLKSDMIRIAAHDLRNPLTGVLGYGQILQETPLTAQQKAYVNDLMISAGRMERIINDILSLERIEASARSATYQTVDFCEVIQRACDENAVAARQKQQQLRVTLAVECAAVFCDKGQLLEAASNLIGNAIKYTPDGGEIDVCAWSEAKQVVLEVRDNGYGIRPDHQANLFKPFFRAKSAETIHIDGTGLGLHLVKRIVERHGGTISFDSVYGAGSTFRFELPIATPFALFEPEFEQA